MRSSLYALLSSFLPFLLACLFSMINTHISLKHWIPSASASLVSFCFQCMELNTHTHAWKDAARWAINERMSRTFVCTCVRSVAGRERERVSEPTIQICIRHVRTTSAMCVYVHMRSCRVNSESNSNSNGNIIAIAMNVNSGVSN